MTPLGFIVPLNAMLYAVRKMGPETVSFVTAVRELWAREKMVQHPPRGRGSEVDATTATAAAAATVAVDGPGGASFARSESGGPRVRVKDGKGSG